MGIYKELRTSKKGQLSHLVQKASNQINSDLCWPEIKCLLPLAKCTRTKLQIEEKKN